MSKIDDQLATVRSLIYERILLDEIRDAIREVVHTYEVLETENKTLREEPIRLRKEITSAGEHIHYLQERNELLRRTGRFPPAENVDFDDD
jgi:FtsZ-binding cell division protein ZapB